MPQITEPPQTIRNRFIIIDHNRDIFDNISKKFESFKVSSVLILKGFLNFFGVSQTNLQTKGKYAKKIRKQFLKNNFERDNYKAGTDVNTDISATNWLLVIFIDPSIDIEITLKIWDAFLCEGNKVLIRWVLAVYMHHEQRLLRCNDQGQIMQILRYRKIEAEVHTLPNFYFF